MKEFKVGGYAVSKAGHDFGRKYVIFRVEDEYVYLVDGKTRTVERPKKKKMKHLISMNQFDPAIADKVIDETIRNEEIKRALKLLLNGNSSKEVE